MSRPIRKLYRDETLSQEALHQVKLELAQCLRRIAMRQGLTQRDLAWNLGCATSLTSLIVRGKVETVSLNQLFRCLAMIEPKFRILISI